MADTAPDPMLASVWRQAWFDVRQHLVGVLAGLALIPAVTGYFATFGSLPAHPSRWDRLREGAGPGLIALCAVALVLYLLFLQGGLKRQRDLMRLWLSAARERIVELERLQADDGLRWRTHHDDYRAEVERYELMDRMCKRGRTLLRAPLPEPLPPYAPPTEPPPFVSKGGNVLQEKADHMTRAMLWAMAQKDPEKHQAEYAAKESQRLDEIAARRATLDGWNMSAREVLASALPRVLPELDTSRSDQDDDARCLAAVARNLQILEAALTELRG